MQRLVQIFASLVALWIMLGLSAFSSAELAANKTSPDFPISKCESKAINNGFEARCSDQLVKPLGRTSEMFLRKVSRTPRKAFA